MRAELNIFEPGTVLYIVTENYHDNDIYKVKVIEDGFCNVMTLHGIEQTRKTKCNIMDGKYKDTIIYITGVVYIYKTYQEAVKACNKDILLKIKKCQDNKAELEKSIKKEQEKEEYLKTMLK